MADQNIIVSSDTVTISGGATDLDVDVNFGAKGTDGNVILYGNGKPQNISSNLFPRPPKLLDWYINLDSGDDEYLYIYQYIYTNNVENWARVFKIIPNTYQTNQSVDFVDGVASASVTVSNTTLPLIPQYRFPSTGSIILPADDEDAMIALSATVGSYAFRKDLAKYYVLVKTPASIASNWEGLITVNAHVDIENELPVVSSFQLQPPQITQNQATGAVSYTLPITLAAYQLVPSPTPDAVVANVSDLLSLVPTGLGPDGIYSAYVTNANSIYVLVAPNPAVLENWVPFSNIQPITGNRTAHISINVI